MSIAQDGKTVTVHYSGTLEDGTEFDNSYKREQPINFKIGSGEMIAGFESAVLGMKVGEKKSVTLKPEDAYGQRTDEAIKSFGREQFPEDFEVVEGAFVSAQTEDNMQIMARIVSFEGDGGGLDFNHPMAGKSLTFNIELLSAV